MSYDLMVFDPADPPKGRNGFMAWYYKQTEWNRGVDCNDPNVSTEALRAWFFDMIEVFPAMNGPHRTENLDDPRATDYAFGKAFVYACFAWSELEHAYDAVLERARKHRLGLFDVSANDGEVWMPKQDGSYEVVHGTGRSTARVGDVRTREVHAVKVRTRRADDPSLP